MPGLITSADQDATGGFRSRPELRAMLAVSRAVARGGPLEPILDEIAREATRVAEGADRASVILIEGSERRFRLAGRHGLSDSYTRLLSTGEAKLRPGDGPSGLAYVTRAPVVISDVDSDPLIDAWTWREIVREEGYGAIVSIPLMPTDATVVGTLNLYRTDAGPWPDEQVQLLTFFAEHAASAVRTAQLLDERSKQLVALRRVVRALREQTHEHANRLHAIDGLLGLGEVEEASELVRVLKSSHVAIREALDSRIGVPTLAGLILAESVAAAQRGITLTIDEDSSMQRLPAMLSETQLVTIVGNLLDNAFDAVATMEPRERQVRISVSDADGRTEIAVTDSGGGLPPDALSLFERGVTTKDGHQGLGLALVREVVTAAMGTIDAEQTVGGTTFRVTFDG
jgi:signal transduction histidine kinase